MVRRRYDDRKRHSIELHTIGIDLGKTVFHLVGLNQCGEVVVRSAQEVFAQTTAALHGEPADQVNWHGSLRRVPLSRTGFARAGSRGPANASAVCQALCEDEQERL